jgi:mono/diheme cytochrome c family protein
MTLRVSIAAGVLLLPSAALADGAELFADFCQGCHGDNAEIFQAFSGTQDRFREILEGDTEDMPDFYGTFSPEEVAELYQYVTELARQP